MKKLLAVPFDMYNSTKTDIGVVYNLIDQEGVVHLQLYVAHSPYANHDMHIKEISQAPSNVRNKSKELLDQYFGQDQWKVVTRFTWDHVARTHRLQQRTWRDECRSIMFNPHTTRTTVTAAKRVSSKV